VFDINPAVSLLAAGVSLVVSVAAIYRTCRKPVFGWAPRSQKVSLMPSAVQQSFVTTRREAIAEYANSPEILRAEEELRKQLRQANKFALTPPDPEAQSGGRWSKRQAR
jgi:endonuclease V-like protein UPF0215 family